jgi:hypothetical protein
LPYKRRIQEVKLWPVPGRNSLVEYTVSIGDNTDGTKNEMCDMSKKQRVYENAAPAYWWCDHMGSRVTIIASNTNKDESHLCEIEAFGPVM